MKNEKMKIEWDGDVIQFFFILLLLKMYSKRMYISKRVWLLDLSMKLIALYYLIGILCWAERLCSLHSFKFLSPSWISESLSNLVCLTSSRKLGQTLQQVPSKWNYPVILSRRQRIIIIILHFKAKFCVFLHEKRSPWWKARN